MFWKIFLMTVIIVTVIVWLSIWQSEKRRASLNGSCTDCGRALKSQMRPETITRLLGGGRGLQRTVTVHDLYCPKCKEVKKYDVYCDLEQARQELNQMSA